MKRGFDMEHTFSATAILLGAVAVGIIGAFAVTGFFENEEPALAAEKSASEEIPPEEQKMFLGVFEGKLALYIGKSPYPNIVYDFLTRTLPEEDQKRLLSGIEVSSETELQSLLEDFMS